MQAFVDFLPIIVFFAVFKLYGYVGPAEDAILAATAAIMIVMTVQIALQWYFKRTVSKMLLISGALVLVFGGITLVLRNALFIQWKPTIFYILLALACLATRFFTRETLVERIMGHAVELPGPVWRQLNWIWIGFCVAIGAINIYVVYNFSQEQWVTFKVYGLIGLSLLMALVSGLWIAKHLPEEEAKKGET
jgi:intracellular septation protein